MWQALFAAAVTASGVFARHLFKNPTVEPQRSHKSQPQNTTTTNNNNDNPSKTQKCQEQDNNAQFTSTHIDPNDPASNSPKPHLNVQSFSRNEDAIFRFSSLESRNGSGSRFVSRNLKKEKKKGVRVRGVKGNVGGIGGQKVEKKFYVCLKRRRVARNGSAKCASCSCKDNSLFGWGLGVGLMYMMSAGKAEINKLNTAMGETAKVVQEMRTELHRRKSSRTVQVSSSVNKFKTNAKKVEGNHSQPLLLKSSPENRDPNDMKNFGLSVTDDGECGSSVLTEEPEPEVLEMDQLEAELESELQKLPGCVADASGHEGEASGFGETEVSARGLHEPMGQSSSAYQSYGVLPSELDQKLCHLLIEQQEGQIMDLESELHSAHSKLDAKEAELQALKDCVRRMTEFSLSSASDDDTEENVEQVRTSDGDRNTKAGSMSKKSVVGMKRSIDSESCDYFVQ